MSNKTKICPYCGKVFATGENARKFCRRKCAVLAQKRRGKKTHRYLCQWCGQVFESERRKKFCDLSCQSNYMSRKTAYRKTVVKIPVKITIEDVAKNSKEEKLTYGRYVSIHKI